MELSDYERAVAQLQQAIKLKPELMAAGFQLSKAFIRLGNYAEALKVLQGMLKSTNKVASIHRHIGDVYTMQQHYRQAVEEYNAVIVHSRGLPEKYPELKAIEESGDDESKAKAYQIAYEKIFSELSTNRKSGDGGRGGRGGSVKKKRARRMN
jgi:tetratricopeptide (TPR) repeat protein